MNDYGAVSGCGNVEKLRKTSLQTGGWTDELDQTTKNSAQCDGMKTGIMCPDRKHV